MESCTKGFLLLQLIYFCMSHALVGLWQDKAQENHASSQTGDSDNYIIWLLRTEELYGNGSACKSNKYLLEIAEEIITTEKCFLL